MGIIVIVLISANDSLRIINTLYFKQINQIDIMDGSKLSQDELVDKLKQQVALENIELLLTVRNIFTSQISYPFPLKHLFSIHPIFW